MKGDRYVLYFGSLRLGVVTEADSDFPNLWGDIDLDPALADPRTAEVARLARFVALDREATRLADVEGEHDSRRAEEAVSDELDAHDSDLIESAAWHLVDEHGRKSPILCPIMRWPAEIVWRWNPDAS